MTMAELKLMRSMQQFINRRTQQLDDEARAGGDEQQRRIEALASEQGELAALIFKLVQPVAAQQQPDPATGSDSSGEQQGLDQLDQLFDAVPEQN